LPNAPAEPDASVPRTRGRFLNRELSWLHFNARVLNEAMDSRTPLLERVRYLQIFTTNLDEFFMKRVGFLKRELSMGLDIADASGLSVSETLKEIRQMVLPMLQQQHDCWKHEIAPALGREGILLLRWDDLTPDDRGDMESFFENRLFSTLTPLAVDPGHPFPFISNLSTSLGLLLKNPQSHRDPLKAYQTEELFARVKIPTNLPSLIKLRASGDRSDVRFIPLNDVIQHFIERLFPGMEILGTMQFSITRNAEVQRDEDEADDLLLMVSEELRERRFARVLRLEHGPEPIPVLRDFLKNELELTEDDVYQLPSTIDFAGMAPLVEINRKDLHFRPWTPLVPEALADDDVNIFGVIREQDILVHHPYESFHHTVERFLRTAVTDPKVVAINVVLYRIGPDNPFIPMLIRAAESGKQVVCLVEIKARFDEERNILVAKSLEKAGGHVVYGVVGLKTHCKVMLVVRDEGEQARCYAHIGTGNYNPVTSQLYTDLGLFTARPDLTRELVHLFHYLTGRSRQQTYDCLTISPQHMKEKFLFWISCEEQHAHAGRPARIVAKMNSLEDKDIIDALYHASAAGVRIDLVVRGVCCLRPRVPGLSDNINVTSVVGRYLEHSRIYYFQQGEADPLQGLFLIGSADWMRRNLSFRVETLVRIDPPPLKSRLFEFLNMLMQDSREGWDLEEDGSYVQRRPTGDSDNDGTHERLMRIYESVRLRPTASSRLR
jgi:polyphosphate kinase